MTLSYCDKCKASTEEILAVLSSYSWLFLQVRVSPFEINIVEKYWIYHCGPEKIVLKAWLYFPVDTECLNFQKYGLLSVWFSIPVNCLQFKRDWRVGKLRSLSRKQVKHGNLHLKLHSLIKYKKLSGGIFSCLLLSWCFQWLRLFFFSPLSFFFFFFLESLG